MKTKKMILLALFATLMLSCNGNEIMRCDFSEVEKQLIPYKKGKIYSFIDGAGKTINIPVIRVETRWPESRDDTQRDYYTFRSDIVELNSEQDNLNIHFRFDANDCILKRGYNKIVFSVVHFGTSSVFILRSNADGILVGDYDEGVIVNTSYHESIEINGKVYYDVIVQSFVTNDKTSIQLFFNKTYGILQIVRNDKNFLTLIPESSKSLSTASMSKLSVDTAPDTEGEAIVKVNQDLLKSLEEESEISAIPQIDFTVYPNPSDGNFTVKVLEEIQPYILEIFSHTGNLIETIRGENQTININKTKFSKGIYYIKLTMDVKTAVRNIVMK